jgi:hypothetical protein
MNGLWEKRTGRLAKPLRLLAVFWLLLIAWSCCSFAEEPRWLPLDQETTAVLLEKVASAKLIPHEVKSGDMTLTITRLNGFRMDWDQAQFRLDCDFTVDYQKSFFRIHQPGQVILSGAGLMVPDEQKLGFRLLRINELRLEKVPGMVSDAARQLADKSLAGKEFWYGEPPAAAAEVLGKDNFGRLLQVAINRILPVSGTGDGTTFTLNRLDDLVLGVEPGQFEARFDMNGTYRKLMRFSFQGQAAIETHAWVDPDAMAGLIRIDEVTDLRMDHALGLVSGIVKGMINRRLKGKEVRVTWH